MTSQRPRVHAGLCSLCFLPVLLLPASAYSKRIQVHDATLAQVFQACELQHVDPRHEAVVE